MSRRLRARLQRLRDTRISGTRIRHHADYQLSNVLYTGSDFVITNFEGDAERPMGERRIKRSPLRDVASMMRSFHYVSHAVLFGHVPGIVSAAKRFRSSSAGPHLVSVGERIFLKGYLEIGGTASSCLSRPTNSRFCSARTCWNAR